MTNVSADDMAVLAANAATALELLRDGIKIDGVRRGLAEGVQFCEFLGSGQKATDDSEYFSTSSLEAGEFLELVLKIPEGDRLVEQAKALEPTLRDVAERYSSDVKLSLSGDLKVLSELFHRFAICLPLYETLRDRLSMELRA